MLTPVIWNITNKCPFSCPLCCIDASGLVEDLTLEERVRIVKNLDSSSIKIDVSGGDPLMDPDNLKIIKMLSDKLGKDRISVTTPYVGLRRINLSSLSEMAYEVGFTYDFPLEPSPNRPINYNRNNLLWAEKASREGIETMAQIPLTKHNASPLIIEDIYLNLLRKGVDSVLLMAFSQSGRGSSVGEIGLYGRELLEVKRHYRRLERRYGRPKIRIAPSMMGNFIGKIFTSLNVTNSGLLLSTPWDYLPGGKPNPRSILGDLTRNKLSEIVGANVYERFMIQFRRNLLR